MRSRGFYFIETLQFETLEARTLFNAGDLDTTFGGSGKVVLSPHVQFVGDVAVQSDGKTIVGAGVYGTANYGLVERLNVDGTPDTTFGNQGTVQLIIPNNSTSPVVTVDITAAAFQPADNKIVVAGYFQNSNQDTYGFVARLNPDGTIDAGFDFSEIGGYDVPSNFNTVEDVAVQQDGKVVVAGTTIGQDLHEDFAVLRFNTNGVRDSSFNGNGANVFNLGDTQAQLATQIAIDYSGTASTNSNYGKIVVAGTDGTSKFAVARLNTNGTLDSSFSGDGKLLTSFGSAYTTSICYGMVIQSTGKIVIEGSVSTGGSNPIQTGLFRLNANGLGDSTFGTSNGQAIVPFTSGSLAGGLINGATGRLIIGGSTSPTAAQVACLSADGVIDPYFATSGILTIHFSGFDGDFYTRAAQFSLGPGGTIVVGGGSSAVARFFDRKAETVSIGTLAPIMYEQGPTSTTFLVTRLERLSTAQQVTLSVSGTADRPGNPLRKPIDYTGTNITFGIGAFSSTYVDIPANETFVEVTITPVDDTLVEGDETAIFTIAPSADYDAVTPTSTTLVIRDNDVSAGPSVRSSAFNYDSGPPQNVTYAFDQDVSSSIGANDFTVTGPSGAMPFALAYDNVNDLATLKFSSVLADGNYTATAIAAGITNSAGTHMAANSSLSFFFLNADANHDRTVNALDFNALATNYGKPGTFSQGDFDYSGTVDSADFDLLASRFGTVLAPPSGSDLPDAATLAATKKSALSLSPQSSSLFGDKPITGDNDLLDDRPVSVL